MELKIQTCNNKRLSFQEECELAARIKDGDETAVDAFVECNIGLVVIIASDMCGGRQHLMPDFVGAGMKGLEIAARKFKTDKGARFGTYASWWIKLEINNSIRKQNLIALHPIAFGCLQRVKKIIAKLKPELGREPSTKEIKEWLPNDSLSMIESVRFVCDVVSLDASSSEDGQDRHELVDSSFKMPFADISFEDDIRLLEKALSLLEEREAEIICKRFGIGCKNQTLDAISKVYGLTKQRICQIEEVALKKLKNIINKLEEPDFSKVDGIRKRNLTKEIQNDYDYDTKSTSL